MTISWSPDNTCIAALGIVEGSHKTAAVEVRAVNTSNQIANYTLGYPRSPDWASPFSTTSGMGLYSGNIRYSPNEAYIVVKGNYRYYGTVLLDQPNYGQGKYQKRVEIWEVARGKKVAIERPLETCSFDWSPDSTKIALTNGEDKTIEIWDIVTKSVIRTYKGLSAAVAWSSDGTRIASTSGHEIHVWDMYTEKPILTLNSVGEVRSVIWLPDSTQVGVICAKLT